MTALPYHLEAEEWILGGILADSRYIEKVAPVIPDSAYFHSPKNKIIYKAILDMVFANEAIDVLTLSDELIKRRANGHANALEAVGGRTYLVNIIESSGKGVNIEKWAEIIKEKYVYRKFIELSDKYSSLAKKQEKSPLELMAEFSQGILSISKTKEERGFRKISSYMPELTETIDRLSRGASKLIGITTGLKDLDKETGGFQGGDLIVIGGRPSMGKTALMNCLASHQASIGYNVAVFSAETRGEEYALRSLCTLARLDSMRLRRGDVDDWDMITKADSKISVWPYYIDDTPEIEINRLIAKATNIISEKDIHIIYVDYIQKLSSAQHFNSVREKYTYIVKTLKLLAQKTGIPIVCLSQLSRACEIRQNKRPLLSDLKETGDIEQEADLIIGLFRKELYIGKKKKDENKFKNHCSAIILKQRNGPIGDVNLYFNPVITRFENWIGENYGVI